MGYVVGLGLQIPELKILFQTDIQMWRCMYFFLLNPVANMAANYQAFFF